MSWNHRVVRLTHDGETQYGIHEVYYGPPGTGWTAEPVAPVAESVEELREVLARMTAALDADTIDGGQADGPSDSKSEARRPHDAPPVPDGPDTELAAISADLDDLHTEAASVAMRSEGSVTAAAEEVRDDVASIRDRLRAVLARPAAGRDLTGQDVWDAMEQGAQRGARLGTQVIADYLNEIARPAVARTDGQPPADEWRVTGWTPRGSRVTADRRHRSAAEAEATAMRDEGLSDVRVEHRPDAAPADDTAAPGAYIAMLIRVDEQDQHDAVDPEVGGPPPEYLRGYRAGVERSAEVAAGALPVPADDTAAATAPWMVESRDERVDRLTRHVENVADCAGIEIEVREAGPLTGPAPLRRLVRALEGAGMLHDDPADDTAAPDGMDLDTFASLPLAQAQAWIKARQEECRRERAAECDANGQHLVLEADTSHCGYCGRLYADIAGGSSPASTDGGEG